MNWRAKQAQILETTRRALNSERFCVFPPVPNTFNLLEIGSGGSLELISSFTNDWTLRFNKEKKQYIVEILATRTGELPEDFGQDSFIAVGPKVFQVISVVTVSAQNSDNLETVGSASMRPTVKLFCTLTKKTFSN